MRDLAYYRLLPYEREWLMRDDAGEKYFIVRLKDLPTIAGDGQSKDEAVEDLRAAFDEFVVSWLEAKRPIPEPCRGFTVPTEAEQAPAKEWLTLQTVERGVDQTTPSWADRAVVYTSNVLVEDSPQEPRLSTQLETAAAG